MKNLTRLLAAGAASASMLLTSCTQKQLLAGDIATTFIGTAAEIDGQNSLMHEDYDCAQEKFNAAAWANAANRIINRYADRDLSRQNTEALANAIQNQGPQVVVVNQGQQASAQHSEGIIYFNSINVEHNVSVNNQQGMKIHVPIRVVNAKNHSLELAAYFYELDGENRTELIDNTDSEYRCSTGIISSRCPENLIPGLEDATYQDITIPIPYSQFHLKKKASLSMKLMLWDHSEGTKVLDQIGYIDFWCNPGTN